MRTGFLTRIATLLMLVAPLSAEATAKDIVVASKPLYGLVQGVVGETGKVRLLRLHEHDVALRPSDVRAMHAAQVVFVMDKRLVSSTLRGASQVFGITDIPGLTILPIRSVYAHHHDHEHHDAHEHEEHHAEHHEHHDAHHDAHEHEEHHAEHEDPLKIDTLLWMDVNNAQRITTAVAAHLSSLNPQHQQAYQRNAEAMMAALDDLDEELGALLKTLEPRMVLHAGYQYLEQAYGIETSGGISVDFTRALSARALQSLKQHIQQAGIQCVLGEKGYSYRVARTLAQDSGVQVGEVDFHGLTMKPGVNPYFWIMREVTNMLTRCSHP